MSTVSKLYLLLLLHYAQLKEICGVEVPKIAIMEVKTQNNDELNAIIQRFFSPDQWEINDKQLPEVPEAFSNHLYVLKRSFFSTHDDQHVQVLLTRERSFVGIVISAYVPRQSFFNLFKKVNTKRIKAFKAYLEQFYEVENFSVEYLLK